MTLLTAKAITDLIIELSPIPGLSPSEIESCDQLLTGGMVDSLGLLQLVEAIESSLGAAIPPAAITIENFNSLAAMARLQETVASNKAA